MKLHSFAVRAFAAVAVTAATAAAVAGTASAAPAPAPLLHTTFNGPVMQVLGQNDLCSGIIDTAIETDPARPGTATVALTPRGMRGIGPGWEQHRVCRVKVTIAWNLGVLAGQATDVDLLVGEGPGETVRTEIHPGSGVAAVSIVASYLSTRFEFVPQSSTPVNAYLLVP